MPKTQQQNHKHSIVILYTELAGYTITCIEKLSLLHGVNIHIINYPVNTEAPFQFNKTQTLITYYNRKDYNAETINELIGKINPDLIYCAGWGDKDYLEVMRKNKKKIPALLGFDNQWNGSFKQRLATLYARIKITPYFNYAFVPGKHQTTFAQKLGFKKSQIIEGAYSAATDFFNDIYKTTEAGKAKKFPHRFIFVGRYAEEKGIKELWEAFITIDKAKRGDWELWCLGTGKIPPVNHPEIKHFGFVQPAGLPSYIEQTGVFVLPSRFEPWGVVVHEFGAAGFPLLISNSVGAKDAFLIENRNGYSFSAADVAGIKNAMEKILLKTDHELFEMGKHSHQTAQCITSETWANSIFNLLQ